MYTTVLEQGLLEQAGGFSQTERDKDDDGVSGIPQPWQGFGKTLERASRVI
jgi:hypothetical protein